MQVEVDMKCMQTNFGGRGLFGFGDIATFQFWPWTVDYSPWGSKIESAQKIHASSSLFYP